MMSRPGASDGVRFLHCELYIYLVLEAERLLGYHTLCLQKMMSNGSFLPDFWPMITESLYTYYISVRH